MTMLRAEFEMEEEIIQQSISESKLLDEELLQDRGQMVRSREADTSAYKRGGARQLRGNLECRHQAKNSRAVPQIEAPETEGLEAAALRGGPDAQIDPRLANLKVLCEEHLKGRYRIEVIDLLESLHMARGDQIVAIPTLVIKLSQAVRKIIGDVQHRPGAGGPGLATGRLTKG